MTKKTKVWRFEVVSHGFSVTAEERVERRGKVTLRFPNPQSTQRDTRRRVQVDLRIRDKSGALRPEAVSRVEAMARALHERIARDRQPSELNLLVNTLTVAQGCALALAPIVEGPYLGSARHHADAERYLNKLIELLGTEVFFDRIRPMDVIGAWKKWAALRQDSLSSAKGQSSLVHPGERCCELALATLEKVAKWLEDNGYMPRRSFAMPSDWRSQLHRDWLRLVPSEGPIASARHSKADVVKLFEALDKVDPRFRLVFLLAAELRIGQALLCMRSHLDLQGNETNAHGTLAIPAAGNKPSVTLALLHDQRAFLDDCLTVGYLRHLEAAFQSGAIRDYPIFAGGRLRDGAIRISKHQSFWNRRSALDEFHRLEEAAGVSTEKGRAWYGVRRLFADILALHTDDNVVLGQLGAHSVETRDRLYRDRQAPELLQKASQIRATVRGSLRAEP